MPSIIFIYDGDASLFQINCVLPPSHSISSNNPSLYSVSDRKMPKRREARTKICLFCQHDVVLSYTGRAQATKKSRVYKSIDLLGEQIIVPLTLSIVSG